MEGIDSDGEMSSRDDDVPSPSSCSLGSSRNEDKLASCSNINAELYDNQNSIRHDPLELQDINGNSPNSDHLKTKGDSYTLTFFGFEKKHASTLY